MVNWKKINDSKLFTTFIFDMASTDIIQTKGTAIYEINALEESTYETTIFRL